MEELGDGNGCRVPDRVRGRGVEDKPRRRFQQRRVAEMAELAAVAEMVAVQQAGGSRRDKNREQPSQREHGRDPDRKTPK